jgi:hypothetical protein
MSFGSALRRGARLVIDADYYPSGITKISSPSLRVMVMQDVPELEPLVIDAR